jgi:hypothetical protein
MNRCYPHPHIYLSACLAVIFAEKKVFLWTNFPDEDMEGTDCLFSTIIFLVKGGIMYQKFNKKPLISQRVREITGIFAWLIHHFIRQGFWNDLTHHKLISYLFLVIVEDHQGISYYSFYKG